MASRLLVLVLVLVVAVPLVVGNYTTALTGVTAGVHGMVGDLTGARDLRDQAEQEFGESARWAKGKIRQGLGLDSGGDFGDMAKHAVDAVDGAVRSGKHKLQHIVSGAEGYIVDKAGEAKGKEYETVPGCSYKVGEMGQQPEKARSKTANGEAHEAHVVEENARVEQESHDTANGEMVEDKAQIERNSPEAQAMAAHNEEEAQAMTAQLRRTVGNEDKNQCGEDLSWCQEQTKEGCGCGRHKRKATDALYSTKDKAQVTMTKTFSHGEL